MWIKAIAAGATELHRSGRMAGCGGRSGGVGSAASREGRMRLPSRRAIRALGMLLPSHLALCTVRLK